MNKLVKLEEEVSAWPNISVHPHRFGDREFLFGAAEVGHVHMGGIVDIPFPRSVRDALLSEGLADGFRIQAGSLFVSEARKSFKKQCGSCVCRTCVTRSSRQAPRERCSSRQARSCI
jgi:Family of unknown function (DUF5519)